MEPSLNTAETVGTDLIGSRPAAASLMDCMGGTLAGGAEAGKMGKVAGGGKLSGSGPFDTGCRCAILRNQGRAAGRAHLPNVASLPV